MTDELRSLQQRRHNNNNSNQGAYNTNPVYPQQPPPTYADSANYNPPQPTMAQLPPDNNYNNIPSGEGSWGCQHCTYSNPNPTQKCEMCHMLNPNYSAPPPAQSYAQAPSYDNNNNNNFEYQQQIPVRNNNNSDNYGANNRGVYNDPYSNNSNNNNNGNVYGNRNLFDDTDDPTPIYCWSLMSICFPICGPIGLCIFSRYWNNPNYTRRSSALRMLLFITIISFIFFLITYSYAN